MPVNYIDRYQVKPEDWAAAQQWTAQTARRLGLVYDKQISAITIYSSDEFWLAGAPVEGPNPDLVTLGFGLNNHWGAPYLRKIEFDVGEGTGVLPLTGGRYVEWKVSENSGDPPASLEELIERGGNNPRLRKRAEEFPAFFELYTGIFERIFPQVEHEHLHTDVGSYDEASSSHIRKELWRTDLLARLQGLRFPPLEIELAMPGKQGVMVTWQPQGHTNYQIWFNLHIGDDPKVCVYTDPTLSGSTTGWLSTRLIKNENALEKLPYTVEQWAVEDLRKNKSLHPHYRKVIRELLLHHVPRDLEEVWAAIRRQLVRVRHEELHTDVSGYDEALIRRLTEAEHLPGRPLTFEEWRNLGVGDRVIFQEKGPEFEGDIPEYTEPYRITGFSEGEPMGEKAGENVGMLHWYKDRWFRPPPEHHELHTDTSAYDESLMRRLTEAEREEERYYGIATGDGNQGVSRLRPNYIVLTDKPWDLAELAAHAEFKADPAIQEWVGKNMQIDGDAEYGISVVFPESMEYQKEREAAYDEYEKRREAAEAAGQEFEEEDPSEEFAENNDTWFIVEIFPIPASEINGYRCEVYDNADHPDFLDSLYPVPEHHELHTDTSAYDEAFLAALPKIIKG